ncbi:hypothetical protein [Nonomuraea lactucae]|uniref:hypothetical protein n=1 Tax=Nonomuraea lactucae TaxID=2249762 RepID=UPI000DE559D2|nr:hypothetical protein [Nonomuraea lactucae]
MSLTLRALLALFALVTLGTSAASGAVTVADASGCPPRDTRVVAAYPITGYWMSPRPDRCLTRRTVEAIHGVGGDTVITFGPRFAATRVDGAGRVLTGRTGEADPDFAGCVDGGRPCYLAARDAIPGRTIRRVFTYLTSEHFGPAVLRCPGLDRRIESGGRAYYRVMLGPSCADPAYDLVLVATDGDGLGDLLTEAAGYGMKVYPGLPAAPQDPAKPWLPDLAHTDALAAFTGRVLEGYRNRFGTSPAFAGVYQSFELAMRDRAPDDEVLRLYRAQHAVVAATLPGRTITVSPYWDARRSRGFPPDVVGEGFAEIAATRAGAPMAIAVQDGRGVGKVPVHGPDQAGAGVDPRLAPVVGEVTNRRAYYGSTRDYIEAAARRPVPGVELWVNVEVFEPTPVDGECGRADPLPLRGRASKSRVDSQIMAAGPYPTKIIAYGWDPFLTCRQRWDTPSLSDDIAAGWDDPIIVHAVREAVGGRDGIRVQGHNLAGGALRLSYRRAGTREASVRAALERHTPPARPGAPESAWAPVSPGGPDPAGPWITVTATNGAGRTSTGGYVLR